MGDFRGPQHGCAQQFLGLFYPDPGEIIPENNVGFQTEYGTKVAGATINVAGYLIEGNIRFCIVPLNVRFGLKDNG